MSLGNRSFPLDNLHPRWRLSQSHLEQNEENCNDDKYQYFGNDERWQRLFSKLELKFRSLGDDTEGVDRLIDSIEAAMQTTPEVNPRKAEDTEKEGGPIQFPKAENVSKSGRPSKEPCYHPWMKKKSTAKSRSEQIRSKVTTGKVISFDRLYKCTINLQVFFFNNSTRMIILNVKRRKKRKLVV